MAVRSGCLAALSINKWWSTAGSTDLRAARDDSSRRLGRPGAKKNPPRRAGRLHAGFGEAGVAAVAGERPRPTASLEITALGPFAEATLRSREGLARKPHRFLDVLPRVRRRHESRLVGRRREIHPRIEHSVEEAVERFLVATHDFGVRARRPRGEVDPEHPADGLRGKR